MNCQILCNEATLLALLLGWREGGGENRIKLNFNFVDIICITSKALLHPHPVT